MPFFNKTFLLLVSIVLTGCGGSTEEAEEDTLPPPGQATTENPHACMQGTWQMVSQVGVNGNAIQFGPVYIVIGGLEGHEDKGTGSVYSYNSNGSNSAGVRIFQLDAGFVQDTYTSDWQVLITDHSSSGYSDGSFTINNACSSVYQASSVSSSLPSCSSDSFTNTSDVRVDCGANPARMKLNSGIAEVHYERINTSTQLSVPNISNDTSSNDEDNPQTDDSDSNETSGSFTFSNSDIWQSDPAETYQSSPSFASSDISDSQTTHMSYSGTTTSGTFSFSYKVSSESGWDFFRFYIDGVEVLEASGEIDWTEFSTTLSSGEHTFKWEYSKDGSQSDGADKIWIANITLPGSQTISPNGSGSTPAEIEILTGTLNLPIEGLSYRTVLQNGQIVAEGITDGTGKILYVENETIQLFIGGVIIYAQQGEETVTIIDSELLLNTLPEINEIYLSEYDVQPSNEQTQLLNRMRLLFTLDQDMDPENGISILSQVSDLFENNQASFELRPKVFAAKVGDNIDAYNRILISRELALYLALNLFDLSVYADREKLIDHQRILTETQDGFSSNNAADGLIDDSVSYTYDHLGRVTAQDFFNGNSWVYEYNDYGYLTKRIINNSYTDTYSYEFNGSGFETRNETRRNSSQLLNYEDSTYDGDGNLVSAIGETIGENGLYPTQRYYTYNGDGYPLTYNSRWDDFNRSDTYRYDDQNRMTYKRSTADSGRDDRWEWDYDLNGNLIREYKDLGNSQWTYNYTYNPNNQLINSTTIFVFGSRIIEDDIDHIYNSDGLLIRTEKDSATTSDGEVLDGIPDVITVSNYDENGNLLSSHDENGFPRDAYQFDSKNRVTQHTLDSDRNGIIEEISVYEYGTGSQPILTQKDRNNDGSNDVIFERTFESSLWPTEQSQGHLDD